MDSDEEMEWLCQQLDENADHNKGTQSQKLVEDADDDCGHLLELAEALDQPAPGAPGSEAAARRTKVISGLNVPKTSQPDRTLLLGSTNQHQKLPGTTETFAGIRVRDPTLPLIILKERLATSVFHKLADLRSIMGSCGLSGGWSTLGVLCEKPQSKESDNGNVYSMCKLSDLDGATLTVILFGKAHEQHWRETEGTVLALFDGQAGQRQGGRPLSVSVKDARQLLVVGRCPDYGRCKGTRKDGARCTIPVNISKCAYCEYHVASQYRKMQMRVGPQFLDNNLSTAYRGLNSAAAASTEAAAGTVRKGLSDPPGPDDLDGRPPKLRRLTSEEIRHQASAAQAARGCSNGARLLRSYADELDQQAEEDVKRSEGPCVGRSTSQISNPGSSATSGLGKALPAKRSRIVQLGGDTALDEAAESDARARAAALIQSLGGMEKVMANQARRPQSTATRSSTIDSSAAATRTGSATASGRSFPSGPARGSKSANDPATGTVLSARSDMLNRAFSRPTAGAGASAGAGGCDKGPAGGYTSTARAHGSLQHQQPSHRGGPARSGGPATADGARAGQGTGSTSAFGQAFAARNNGVADETAAARQGTRYKGLVDNAEHDSLLQVMDSLEEKDAVADKMQSITRLEVSAFHCQTCRRISERRYPECQDHLVRKVKVFKTWWICGHCGHHFDTVGVKYPKNKCRKCKDPGCMFRKASMYKGGPTDKAPPGENCIASRDKLLVRGIEQPFALNSLA